MCQKKNIFLNLPIAIPSSLHVHFKWAVGKFKSFMEKDVIGLVKIEIPNFYKIVYNIFMHKLRNLNSS